MKNTMTILALAAAISVSGSVAAEVISPAQATKTTATQGGFQGPNNGHKMIETVELAKDARDDNKVVLTGHIKSSLGNEKYIFADSTGEITVEIDNDKWHGRTVTTENNVILRGEVDKDWNDLTIDVDSLEVQ